MGRGYSTKTIVKALDLIDILKEKNIAGVTELGKELGLNKNNVFRILVTLQDKELVQREGKEYKLGIGFLKLEHSYIRNLKFPEIARPYLKELRNRTGETIYLSILHEDKVVYIVSIESKKSVVVNSRIAKRYPSDKTASGKILKSKPKDFVVAYDFGETEEEVSEIAVPIYNRDNEIISALSIVAPEYRLNKNNVKEFEKELIEIAKKITEEIKEKM
jgi:DNA-binding IclR family transcriptional regulator